MNSLIRSLVRKVGVRWFTSQVRAAAEGKLGEGWSNFYWGLVGHKTELSFFFGLAAAVAAAAGYPYIGEGIAFVAMLGVTLGFADAKWRTTAEDDWLHDNAVFKFLAHNSPTITTALVAGLAWFHSADCTFGQWCAHGGLVITLIGYAFVHVGIVDAAWNAPPPRVEENE